MKLILLSAASVLTLIGVSAHAETANAPIATASAASSSVLSTPADAAPAAAIAAPKGFFERWVQGYVDDFGPPPPADPNAPATRRAAPFPPAALPVPPFPAADWNYGGSEVIGASGPNQVDSKFTSALWGVPGFGKALKDSGIQIYGWIEPGVNLSTADSSKNPINKNGKNANSPTAYSYDADTLLLDQATLYVERVPDTVQKDHDDWGFRVTAIYGSDYRYTTADGLWSYQYLKHNHQNGYDLPMAYWEYYTPSIGEGTIIRVGRYISLPDIEAQLAPNNYMYSHSLLYGYDPYTDTGVTVTTQLTKNWLIQEGLNVGNDIMPWVKHDNGLQPSGTFCVRWNSDTSNDNDYFCANNVNDGKWGYNNLAQHVNTYYHKFNAQWHVAWETWYMTQKETPATGGPAVGNMTDAVGGTQGIGGIPTNWFNAPYGAWCHTGTQCRSEEWATLAYLNWQFATNDNLSFRTEYFDDETGQRTGFRTAYRDISIGWQHAFSNSIMIRPELAHYESLRAAAFNNGTQKQLTVVSADLIFKY